MSLSINRIQERTERLVEYFCVVGLGEEIKLAPNPCTGSFDDVIFEEPLETCYNAEVLDRYPLKDREEYGFADGVALFCFPDGLKLKSEMKLPSFFTFVQTGDDGTRVYGHVITFYEELTEKQKQGLHDLHFTGLGGDAGDAIPTASDDFSKYLIPKCLCIISSWPFMNEFKEWLSKIYQRSSSRSPIPIERLLCNFMDEIPCPQPAPDDKVEVMMYFMGETTMEGKEQDKLKFQCPPSNDPTAWANFPLKPLFECLDVANILQLFTAILVERKVLVVSSYFFPLTTCMETMMLLIYPLVYPHVYIPICPEALLIVMNAPMPLFVGTRRDFLTDEVEIPEEVVRVDLDENVVDLGSLGELPSLPPRRRDKLILALEQYSHLFTERGASWKTHVLPKMELAVPQASTPDSGNYDEDLARARIESSMDWAHLREAFLKFFVAMLSDWERYTMIDATPDSQGSVFSKGAFLKSHPKEWRLFLDAFIATQAFASFIDQMIAAEQSDEEDLDVKFFSVSIKAKENRSKTHFTTLRKADTSFLEEGKNARPRTVVALSPEMAGLDSDEVNAAAQETSDWSLDHSHGTLQFIYHCVWPRLSPTLYYQPREIQQFGGRPISLAIKRGQRRKRAFMQRSLLLGRETTPKTAADAVYSLWCLAFADSLGKKLGTDITRSQRHISVDPNPNDGEIKEDTKELFSPASTVPRGRLGSRDGTLGRSRRSLYSLRGAGSRKNMMEAEADTERHMANAGLDILMDVLCCVRRQGVFIEESAFRALMQAAYRAGNAEKATQVVFECQQAGFQPDPWMSKHLLGALAKDPRSSRMNQIHSIDNSRTAAGVLRQSPLYNQAQLLTPNRKAKSPGTPGKFTNLKRRLLHRKSLPQHHQPSTAVTGILGHMVEKESFSEFVQQQTLLGETILEHLYPDLMIDTSNKCKSEAHTLDLENIKYGWRPDPESYVTACPFCVAEAEALAHSTGTPAPPPEDFSPVFKVHCSDPEWQGSTGKGSVLFCNYLSPWSLRKYLRKILENESAEVLLSPEFSRTNPQVFWNLILHFKEYSLPLTFLFTEIFPGGALLVSPMMDI